VRLAIKNEVKDEIAGMFQKLKPGEFMRHDQIILTNPTIMQHFYLYDYTLSNHKTVPYLRRLAKEVTKDDHYGVGHISPLRIPVKVGRKYKRYWAWGYPDKSQGKVVLMQYDMITGGIIGAQADKAGHLGLPTETGVTQKALEEAKAEEKEAAAEAEEEEETPKAEQPEGSDDN
jgi:hypothetical protein